MTLDYAVQYAARGYRVLPVRIFRDDEGVLHKVPANKRVLCRYCPEHSAKSALVDLKACRDCKGGSAAATSDVAEVRRLWERCPGTAHVGVIPPSGVVIIDDDGHVFDDVWAGLPRVRTVSGKHHYWFRLADGQEQLRSENGIVFAEPDGLIDLRCAEGGYWIAAPCGMKAYTRENGWRGDPAALPVLPAEVYERLRTAPRTSLGGGGGPGGGKYVRGMPQVPVGGVYDRVAGECEALLHRQGWQELGGGKWMRPGGTQHNAVLSESEGVWFFSVFTSSPEAAPLQGGRYYTASMLRCLFEHGGNWATCATALVMEGISSNA